MDMENGDSIRNLRFVKSLKFNFDPHLILPLFLNVVEIIESNSSGK